MTTNLPIYTGTAILTPKSDTVPVVIKVKAAEGYLMHITGGMREGTNPFGHTALAVDGAGMYSYGNSTPLGSDPLKYIREQSKVREQQITIIPIAKSQHNEIIKYFQGKVGMNSIGIIENCAVRTAEALSSAGIKIEATPFPGDIARRTMKLPGVQNFSIKKNGSIPSELSNFIRQHFSSSNPL